MQAAVLKSPRFIPKPKGNPRSATSLQQLVALQAKVHGKAMHPKTTAKVLCLLSRAFVELERLRRDMRGLPNPRPMQVDALSRVKRISSKVFLDPAEVAQSKIAQSSRTIESTAAQPEAATGTTPQKKESPQDTAAQPAASTDCAACNPKGAPGEDQDTKGIS